jgi:hypothetical protein
MGAGCEMGGLPHWHPGCGFAFDSRREVGNDPGYPCGLQRQADGQEAEAKEEEADGQAAEDPRAVHAIGKYGVALGCLSAPLRGLIRRGDSGPTQGEIVGPRRSDPAYDCGIGMASLLARLAVRGWPCRCGTSA